MLFTATVGLTTLGNAVPMICPLVAAGDVAPKPVPKITTVSPGFAGVVAFAIKVVGPTISTLFAWRAATYLSPLIRKNAGAVSCTGKLTAVMSNPLLATTIAT